jgi:hypothetical protein
MDVAAEMPELADFVAVERGANAERTDRAIKAGLSIRIKREQ